MGFWENVLQPGTLFGIAGTVISIILAIILYIKGKRKTLLTRQIISTDLISKKTKYVDSLKVVVDDQPVTYLVSTTLIITNRGNTTIESSSFASKEPLQLITTGKFFNTHDLSHSPISSDNPNSTPSLLAVGDNKVQITFDFLKPKDSLSVTLFHNGEARVSGELKDGEFRDYTDNVSRDKAIKENLEVYSVFRSLLVGVIASLMCALIIFGLSQHERQSDILAMYEQLQQKYEDSERRFYELQQEQTILIRELETLRKATLTGFSSN